MDSRVIPDDFGAEESVLDRGSKQLNSQMEDDDEDDESVTEYDVPILLTRVRSPVFDGAVIESLNCDDDEEPLDTARNIEIACICGSNSISISNDVFTTSFYLPEEIKPVKPQEIIVKSAGLEPFELELIDDVCEETVRKSVSEKTEKFDYWLFQSRLKQKTILKEACWLKVYVHVLANCSKHFKRLVYPEPDEQDILQQFQKAYGPISENTGKGQALLKLYKQYLRDSKKKVKKKLELVLEYSKEYGKDAASKLVEDLMETEMKRLNLPPLHLGRMPSTMTEDIKKEWSDWKLYNANPITSHTHSEWFLLPRFFNQFYPSDLTIHHPTLENRLVEYTKSPEVTIVDGYWPSLLDPAFTPPIKLADDDPPTEEKEGTQNEKDCETLPQATTVLEDNNDDNTDKSDNDEECIRKYWELAINKFPLGIEADKFFTFVEEYYINYPKDAPLLEGLNSREAVKLIPDIFLTNKLPCRDALILFPSCLEEGLTVGPTMPVMEIIRSVWDRVIYTVRINDGAIRFRDLDHLYEKMFKVGIRDQVECWGFLTGQGFVQWCTQQWTQDGTRDRLQVNLREGTQDAFLVYVPYVYSFDDDDDDDDGNA